MCEAVGLGDRGGELSTPGAIPWSSKRSTKSVDIESASTDVVLCDARLYVCKVIVYRDQLIAAHPRAIRKIL